MNKMKKSELKNIIRNVIKEQFESGCTEQQIKEGTCGYGEDGKIGRKPAGSHLMKERFQKLANIK